MNEKHKVTNFITKGERKVELTAGKRVSSFFLMLLLWEENKNENTSLWCLIEMNEWKETKINVEEDEEEKVLFCNMLLEEPFILFQGFFYAQLSVFSVLLTIPTILIIYILSLLLYLIIKSFLFCCKKLDYSSIFSCPKIFYKEGEKKIWLLSI
jgi:hypothetical protein